MFYKKTRDEGFGMEVKRRMMIGAFVLSSGYYDAYYIKALQVKALIKKGFDEAFAKYDIILGPTAPTTALKMGENLSDPLKMYLAIFILFQLIWQAWASVCLAVSTAMDCRSVCR